MVVQVSPSMLFFCPALILMKGYAIPSALFGANIYICYSIFKWNWRISFMGLYLSTIVPLLMGEICGHCLFTCTIDNKSKKEKYKKYLGHLKSWVIAGIYWLVYMWLHQDKYTMSFNPLNFVFTFFYSMLVESLVFYLGHRLQHTDVIYNNSHFVHHSISSITHLDGDNLHNIDIIMNATSMLLPVMTSHYLHNHKLSLYGWYSFLFIRQFITADCHSSLPSTQKNLLNLIPFYMTRNHHRFHHHGNRNKNFGYYKIWEVLFGTYVDPNKVGSR